MELSLDSQPWINLDGPSVVSCAAALQLLKENIPFLMRAKRLAAIGAALPARLDAPAVSPSGLRALLKHPVVGGDEVRSQEDPYDDVYVEEVAFLGRPRLVIQGSTNRSAHTLRILLNAIFSPAATGLPGLPRIYIQQARPLVEAVLNLSDAVCLAAGLRRGMSAPQGHRREPFVPGREKLAELRGNITFQSAELADLQALDGWIVGTGAHRLAMSTGSDHGLILTPLLRHGPDLIVANPGELASALRHHLIVLAMHHGCRDRLAEMFRQAVAEHVADLLDGVGAIPLGPAVRASDPLVLRQRFSGAANTIIDVGVLTDDLSGYNRAEPVAEWGISNLGERLQECLDPPGDPDEEDHRTLRLAVIDDVGRYGVIEHLAPRRPGVMLKLTSDELRVMIDLDGSDPLFLWRFAQAVKRLRETSLVVGFGKLDTYAIYRNNGCSFYLSDDPLPELVTVAPGSGAELRLKAQRKYDRHHVLAPDKRRYVEVMAIFGLETAPIYRVHPRHGVRAFVVELGDVTVWVLPDMRPIESIRALVHEVMVAVAYWMWQLGQHMPEALLRAADAGGRILVTVAPDEPRQWSKVFAGKGPDQKETVQEGAESDSVPDSSISWVTASAGPQGDWVVVLHSDRAKILLSDANIVDRQLLATLAQALAPAEPLAAVVDRLAPLGPKRMIRVLRPWEVISRPVDVSARTVQSAVSATVLAELGQWLAGQGLAEGPVAADSRTEILNKAVDHCYEHLTRTIAGLSPDGLMAFLVLQDEALLQDAAIQAERLPSQLACFGAESVLAQDLVTARGENVTASIASRFLVEYVAATPPAGDRAVDLLVYDEILALAAVLISVAMLSDAIRYGFSNIEISMLPSGRLGASDGDRYSAGIRGLAQIEAEIWHTMALGPTSVAEAPTSDTATAGRTPTKPPLEPVNVAMRAEFGFSLTDAARGLRELIALIEETDMEPCVADVAQIRTRLRTALTWDEGTAQAFLDKLSLRPRVKFLSVRADAYPWKFNRNLSYMRRPIIELQGPHGERTLMWGARRASLTHRYWAELIFTGRLKGTTEAMRRLMGTIRQDQNKAFERQVATVMSQSCMPIIGNSVKRIGGRRLLSRDGVDLGDIDAIGLDPTTKIIIVAEAKDFELARTPVELANEAKELLVGDKSAAFKHRRRTEWIRSNAALVLRHFGVFGGPGGWRVLPVIVTSRSLISPRVLEASIPVVAIRDLPSWIGKSRRSLPRRRHG